MTTTPQRTLASIALSLALADFAEHLGQAVDIPAAEFCVFLEQRLAQAIEFAQQGASTDLGAGPYDLH